MQPAVHPRGNPLPHLPIHFLRRLESAATDPACEPRWSLPEVTGRLVELSGQHANASLSLAFRLVLDAQRRGEHVAWVTGRASTFYPPDVAEVGVDLDALSVVRVPRDGDVAVAGEWLARCGSFGLVVLDLCAFGVVPMALQSRLLAQAQKHDLAIVCLTEKPASSASLSSLVSLRGEARLRRRPAAAGSSPNTREERADLRPTHATARDLHLDAVFECELAVLKDKRRSRSWSHVEVARGTPGLR